MEGEDKQEADPDTDCAIGNVERRETNLIIRAAALDVKAHEINYVADANSVQEVAEDAPKNEAERHLAPKRVDIEVVAGQKKNDEGGQGGEGQDAVVAAEDTPGRASVAPVDEFKKAVDDDLFLSEGEMPQHDQLCELIHDKDCQSQDGNAPGRIKLHAIFEFCQRIPSV